MKNIRLKFSENDYMNTTLEGTDEEIINICADMNFFTEKEQDQVKEIEIEIPKDELMTGQRDGKRVYILQKVNGVYLY